MYQLKRMEEASEYYDTDLQVKFEIPDTWESSYIETPDIDAIGEEAMIREAIQDPKYGESLIALVDKKKASSASVLVSDATRAVPTAEMLKYVVEELVEAGITMENIYVFVAIGVHREATEEEKKKFLGELYGKIQIENHTPFKKKCLQYLGETSQGTPVYVNKKAWECDLHIQIGKVEPHEFAGFSGGRKSVLPGISAEKTIIVNHRPEMILNDKATIGVLDGNPVHLDMVESARMYGIDFGVNCILNNKLELAAVFAGDMDKAHLSAVSYVREHLGVEIERPDILVTTPGQPLDIDFYQTLKALIALTEVLEKETVVVLYCGCPEGIQSPDMLRAFSSGDTIEKVVEYTSSNYKIQMDHVLLISKILTKGVRIIVCCPNITDEEAREMFMIPCHTPEEAMIKAMELTHKKEGKVLFYPRPQTGLPIVRK